MAVRDPPLDHDRAVAEREPEIVQRVELQRERRLDLRAPVADVQDRHGLEHLHLAVHGEGTGTRSLSRLLSWCSMLCRWKNIHEVAAIRGPRPRSQVRASHPRSDAVAVHGSIRYELAVWRQRQPQPPTSNYIDGEWVASRSGKTFENRNPANTDDLIGVFQHSTAEDVQRGDRRRRPRLRSVAPRAGADARRDPLQGGAAHRRAQGSSSPAT